MYRTEPARGEGADLRATSTPPVLDQQGARQAFKRVFDFVSAALLLIALLPLFVAVVICVFLTSGCPVIYSHERIGRFGRKFRLYKFRSMCRDADERLSTFLDSSPEAQAEWAAFHKLTQDPRITPFGKFMRKSSLDELPQLWNVLTGDMSLIGPRPVTAVERTKYGAFWASYCSVRPGISGLAQVSGRSQLTYQERVRLDVEYVKSWSMWLDVKLLFRTVGAVFSADGSH